MFQYLFYVGAFLWAAWKIKGAIFLAILLLFIGGCNAVEQTCYYDAYGDHFCTKTYYFESTPQPTEVTYVVEEKAPEDTVILIEKWDDDQPYHQLVYTSTPYCGNLAKTLSPYPWQPDTCCLFADGSYECDWAADTGWRGPLCYETYLWDDEDCQWYYLFDWCDV